MNTSLGNENDQQRRTRCRAWCGSGPEQRSVADLRAKGCVIIISTPHLHEWNETLNKGEFYRMRTGVSCPGHSFFPDNVGKALARWHRIHVSLRNVQAEDDTDDISYRITDAVIHATGVRRHHHVVD